jgi:hypothetical protein
MSGCAWIDGDPTDYHTRGDAIFCSAPVTEPGSPWCATHRARVVPQFEL